MAHSRRGWMLILGWPTRIMLALAVIALTLASLVAHTTPTAHAASQQYDGEWL